MHVVVAGCGRVGSQLATELSHLGHDVVVIDKNEVHSTASLPLSTAD